MAIPLPSWDDSDYVPLSALEHFSYCPRQCGLIHLEQTWDENLYTLRGRQVHEKVDVSQDEIADGVRVLRGLPLWCDRLGLVGRADVVELHPKSQESGDRNRQSALRSAELWTPFPVEYKRGQARQWGHDDLQLCGQAVCLEEMTGQAVPRGAVFHHASRRRRIVEFTPDLRRRLEQTVVAVRAMLRQERLPEAVNDKRCRKCSLIHSCLPTVLGLENRLRTNQRLLMRGGG
jgi:CRISPR-associated exonuclease Cas4